MQRFDRYWIGITLGLILPAVVAVVYVGNFNLWDALLSLSDNREVWNIWRKLTMLSVFPNLALLFIFYTTDTWRLSKGVLIGTFPYILASIACSIAAGG